MSKTRETTLEIDLKSLEHNYAYLRSKISSEKKFMAVVKAFAYGSDAVEIATKLEQLGTDYFAVAYVSEGINLRKGGITKPILVLHPQSTHFDEIIEHSLTPSIYSQFVLREFLKTAKKYEQKDYPFHLKINTGMNRLGFVESELTFVTDLLQKNNLIKLSGIYSHFAASDDLSTKNFTLGQIDNFKKISSRIIDETKERPILHLCNTSGILNFPEAHFDMVRSGIGLYGFGNSAEEDANLIPVATLKTIVSQIHHIKKGDTVGYNYGFIAEKPTKTATLPLGHADGINRIYGKQKASVLINGKLAPIIGNVCMDMIMVDITGISCQEGDAVIVFGKTKSAEEFAQGAGTISYELITSISQRVKRKIIC